MRTGREHEVYCVTHRRRMILKRSPGNFPFVEYLFCSVDRCGALIRLTRQLWHPRRGKRAVA